MPKKQLIKSFESDSDSKSDSDSDIEGQGMIDLFQKLIYGRKELSPTIKKFLKQHGNEEIISIEINRTPVRKLLIEALQFFSKGQFKQNMKDLNYDKLFHLKMNIKTNKGTFFSLEKNEVITLTRNPKNTSDSESINVPQIPPHLTTIKMIETARSKVGTDNLFVYSAQHRNCQHFISDLLKANGMNNNEVIEFVKQDVEKLFKDTGFLRKISNITTDIASRIDVLKEGGGSGVSRTQQSHPLVIEIENYIRELLLTDIPRKEEYARTLREAIAPYIGNPNLTAIDLRLLREVRDNFQSVFDTMNVRQPRPRANAFHENDPDFTGFGFPNDLRNNAGYLLEREKQLNGGGLKRTPNKWIQFVKTYSKKYNLSYMEALKSPKLKELYHKQLKNI